MRVIAGGLAGGVLLMALGNVSAADTKEEDNCICSKELLRSSIPLLLLELEGEQGGKAGTGLGCWSF